MPRTLYSQGGMPINTGESIVGFKAPCDALGAEGIIGALFHEMFSYNPYHKTMTKTPQAAVVNATLLPERGGRGNAEAAFRPQEEADLWYGATLIGVLPGLYAEIDATTTSGVPVVDDLFFPLKVADAEAVSSQGNSTAGYLATYYGANADTVVTNATTACSTPTTLEYAAYCVEAGLYMFKHNYLKAGSSTIDSNLSQYIAAENALNGTIDQDTTEMWGGAASLADSVLKSMFTRYVYVILPFFFSRNVGTCFSLISSIFSKPEIVTQVAHVNEITFRSESNVVVKVGSTGAALANSDLQVGLDCRFILLENLLRDGFACADFEQVILVTDIDRVDKTAAASTRVDLNAKGYALGFIIMVQRHAAADKNMWSYYAGIDGRDALVNININVNSTCLMNMEATRARIINAAMATPRIPTIPVYLYSFTVDLFSDTILMGRNLAVVHNVTLQVTWQAGLESENATIFVFTVMASLLKYRQHHASLMFK